MKFGVLLPHFLPQAKPSLIRETALRAEGLGYASVWTTDHVMIARDTRAPFHTIYEAVSTLSWVAAVTERVRLGISALIVSQRQPVLVAKELATLDRLSGGRMILALEVGWPEAEFAYLGVDFRTRGRRMDEGIDVLRSLWRNPEAPFHGRFTEFENQSFAPMPIQPGGPPIWIRGHSEPALARAAARADGWHPSGISPEQFQEGARRLQALAGERAITLSTRVSVGSSTERGFRYVLGGDDAEVRGEIQRFAVAGCEHMVLSFWDTGDPELLRIRMERFAREILPAFPSPGSPSGSWE